MQTRTLLAAIATAAVAAIAIPSQSNAQVPPKPTKPTTPTTQPTTPMVSKGEVATAPSFGSLMSAINSASARTDSIKALHNVTASNVQLVNVEDLLKGNDVEALNSALKKNEAAISSLRSALGSDSTISNVITTGGGTSTTAAGTPLTANDIVAADVAPDGKVILYYWKKQS